MIYNDEKDELLRAFERLSDPVELAVKEAQKRSSGGTDDRTWADIANADRLFVTNVFVTDAREARFMRAYKDAVPQTEVRFVRAAKAKLELFAKLGIKDALAGAIIAELDRSYAKGSPVSAPPTIVIIAGHRIDEPGGKTRFPESAVPAVTERLREKLAKLSEGAAGVRMLSSGAPGTDIICHELCRDLGVRSTICLPMPVDDYAKETFTDQDGWRSRFLALVGGDADRLQLSDMPGLPRWLRGTNTDEWERGNRWVLQMALTAGAPKVSLIAVWDGAAAGDAKGGLHTWCGSPAPPGPSTST
jgi:hypothetical protein